MTFVTRAQWGARPPTKQLYKVHITNRTEWYLHHTLVWSDDHRYCDDVVRRIQLQHQRQGWSDIGYAELGCPHGVVYEGRGIDHVGAHCPGHNRSAIGYALMWDGRTKPPVEMYVAARERYVEHCRLAGKELLPQGHRDGRATVCPGPHPYEWVHGGMPVPAPAPPAPQPIHYPEDNVMLIPLQCSLSGGKGYADVFGYTKQQILGVLNYGPDPETSGWDDVHLYQPEVTANRDGVARVVVEADKPVSGVVDLAVTVPG